MLAPDCSPISLRLLEQSRFKPYPGPGYFLHIGDLYANVKMSIGMPV